jgi:hypothetical protein
MNDTYTTNNQNNPNVDCNIGTFVFIFSNVQLRFTSNFKCILMTFKYDKWEKNFVATIQRLPYYADFVWAEYLVL